MTIAIMSSRTFASDAAAIQRAAQRSGVVWLNPWQLSPSEQP